MSADALLRALRNKRIVGKMLFTDAGMFPGPEPVVELPFEAVLVDQEKRRLLMSMNQFIALVESVLKKEHATVKSFGSG